MDQVEQVSVIVEEAGGVDRIEALQQHENEDVYNAAYNIIDKYFSAEEVRELTGVGVLEIDLTLPFTRPCVKKDIVNSRYHNNQRSRGVTVDAVAFFPSGRRGERTGS